MISLRRRRLGRILAMSAAALALVGGVLGPWAAAGRWGAEAAGPSNRAYVANEGSGTISVIDTTTDQVIDTICLGSDPAIAGTPQPNGRCDRQHHAAFYNGHADPHGLWLTPDGGVLLVANRLSSSIVAVDTAAKSILGYTPVGREPHLATVSPDGREAWVAVRGESHVDVLRLDNGTMFNPAVRRTDRMPRVDAVDTALGPSMVSFTSDGKHAFVAAGKQARVDKVKVSNRKVVASQGVAAAFTPFGLVTPDDQEIYLVHKGAGKLSILRTSDLTPLVEGMAIGPRANHVYFVGKLAYVTIGGPPPSSANPDPEGKVVVIDRTTRQVVRQLTGGAWTGDPHAVWATPDSQRLYVGHERGSRVTVIELGNVDDASDDVVKGVVTGPEGHMANLNKPIDIVATR